MVASEPSVLPTLAPIARRRRISDRTATTIVYAAFALAAAPLIWIVWAVISQGGELLKASTWWTHSQRNITPDMVGGGAYHAILGSVLQTAVCVAIAVPIAIFTAIYLVEYGSGKFARAVSFCVDVLTGIPSIVSALFIYAVWVGVFGWNRVGFAVSLSLILLMIPVVVRSTEEMLYLVPISIREASYALGVRKSVTIVKVVLPTALSGIVTGILLGIARVMGETAPLLILGPYAPAINSSLFNGFQAALPTMIKDQFDNPDVESAQRMWAAACTLILIVLLFNISGRLLARRTHSKLD